MRLNRFRIAALALAMTAGLASAQPTTTAFTYQGRLSASGATSNGNFDFIFELYDSLTGGNLIAGPVAVNNLAVSNGLFTTPIDFGQAWPGQRRWLRIQVRTTGAGPYSALLPRQEVTAAPMSLYALRPWETVTGQSYPSNGYYLRSGDNSYFGMDADYGDLHVNGGNDGAFAIFSEGAPTGSFNVLTKDASNTMQTRFTIDNGTGNVGIGGITSSQYRLSVSGSNGPSSVAAIRAMTSASAVAMTAISNSGSSLVANNVGSGLSGPTLNVSNSHPAGISIVSNTNSSDANIVIGQEGLGDALRVFHSYGGFVGGPLLQVQYDGSLIIDAAGQYTDNASFYGSPRIRFGVSNSGEWIASNRLDAVDSQNGVSFYTANALRGYFKNNGEFVVLNTNARKPGGGPWATTSDARVKKNIRPLTGSLESLLSIHGFTFEYIDPEAVRELPGVRTGLVAQDVERIFPDWVSEDAKGLKSVGVHGFEALTVEALRDLRAEKDAQIAALRAENEQLREQLAAQTSDLARRLEAIEARADRPARVAR